MAVIQAARGPIVPEELGTTLCHEHVFINLLCLLSIPQSASRAWLRDSPVSMEMLGELWRDPLVCRDNLVLSDEQLSARELLEFKRQNGGSLCDVTVR